MHRGVLTGCRTGDYAFGHNEKYFSGRQASKKIKGGTAMRKLPLAAILSSFALIYNHYGARGWDFLLRGPGLLLLFLAVLLGRNSFALGSDFGLRKFFEQLRR